MARLTPRTAGFAGRDTPVPMVTWALRWAVRLGMGKANVVARCATASGDGTIADGTSGLGVLAVLWSGRLWTAVLWTTVAALSTSQAAAQEVETARRQYLSAEFEESAASFEAILARPSLDRADAAEAHRYLAALRQMLGDAGAASQHADAAVALDPTVEAPEGAAPETAAALAAARDRLGGQTAVLRITASERAGPNPSFRTEAVVAPAPPAMADRIELRCVSGPHSATERAALPRVVLTLEQTAGDVVCRASVRTAGGATLLETRETLSPALTAPAAALASMPEAEDDSGSVWPIIGVGAGVAAIGATVLLVVLMSGGDQATLGGPEVEGW